MKWLRTIVLFDRGDISSTEEWSSIHSSYVKAISAIDFPEGSGSLTLKRKQKLPKGQWDRNGVGYLKNRFMKQMTSFEKWEAEVGFNLDSKQSTTGQFLYPSLESYREPVTSNFGQFDLLFRSESGLLAALEWETGNISSSHRSMNKLAIALNAGKIQIGVLIIPSRSLYEHLTDRIGNIGELSGYLSIWERVGERTEIGLLAITIVEHDELTSDPDFPYLPTGNDGRAREGRARAR